MTSEMTPKTADLKRSSDEAKTLHVEIFGSTYKLRSENDPQHVEALAQLVDQKMRAIAGRTTAVETSRIAILAALNLADDLVRSRRPGDSGESKIAERAASLLDRLERALDQDDASSD